MDQAFVRVCDDCFRVGDWAGGYVIRVGGVGVCIDAPGGAWIERLDEIGVSRVEWVLATHHHRDTLASAGALVAGGARLIAPSAERGLVADVEQFWQTARTYVLYNCGSEFFSLRQNVPVERGVADGDELDLSGLAVRVFALPGHTRGSVGYGVEVGGKRLLFVGDNMAGVGQVHNWHDLHWDYMDFNTGAKALRDALAKARAFRPDILCPAHAPAIYRPTEALDELGANLARFIEAVEPNRLPRPYDEARRITDHLHFLGMTTYVIIADSGKGFVWDFGYVPETRARLEQLGHDAGLKHIDVLSMSHYHDDHILRMAEVAYALGKDHTQPRSQIWCHRVLHDVLTRPHAYRLPCLIPTPLPIDRILDDERFTWEGIEMELLHMPGQTWWHAGLIAHRDGKTMAFTGDDIWHPGDRTRAINGPIISRNRYLPGHGHGLVAQRLIDRGVNMICPAHGEPFDVSRADLEGYRRWGEQADAAIRALAGSARLGVDAWWCRIDPFHVHYLPGRRLRVSVVVESPFDRPVRIGVALRVPDGFEVAVMQNSLYLQPGERDRVDFSLHAGDQVDATRRALVTAELTVDGQLWGELCEGLLIPRRV